jgi:AcrR family transcriptional regulator
MPRGARAPLQCSEASSLRQGMPKPAAPTSPESTIEADAAPRRKRGRPAQDANEGLRRALIEQSARLFREKGYGNTTVRDIAAATGVHAGSWFYYFKTKQDILQAVIEHGLTVALADIEAIDVDGLPPREAMRQLGRAHLTTILAPNHDVIPVMLYEWRSLDAEAQERIIALKDRYESIWTRLMERLRASGDWAQPTPVDRLLMFGALNWTAQWYQAGAGISIDALADQAVLFILRTPAPPAA